MEKKYYFRGLGLGIIVTAIIMGIALPHGTKTREMTDEEVIARAKELGMIEDSRLLESTDEEPAEEAEAPPETPVKKDIAVKSEAAASKKDTVDVEPSGTTDTKDTADVEPSGTTDTKEPAETTTSAASTETVRKADTNEMTKQDDDVASRLSGTEGEDDTDASSSETEQDAGRAPAATGAKSITIVSGDSSYTIAKKLETAGLVSSASSYDTYLCEHGYDKKLRAGTFQIPAGATDDQIARIVTGQQ